MDSSGSSRKVGGRLGAGQGVGGDGGRLQGLAPSSTPGSGLTSSHLASVTSLSTGQGQGTGSSHGW